MSIRGCISRKTQNRPLSYAAALTVVTAGACTPLLVAATVTFAAGAITVANGASEIVESATGYNFMWDTVCGGNEELYEGQKEFFSAVAEVGTAVISMGSASGKLCFAAGTVILINEGRKAIEDIVVGDYVWAWDEETGEKSLRRVTETYVNQTSELVHVFVGGEEIVTTPTHPFYSPVKGWTEAAQLRAGDILVLVNGEYVVVEKVQHEILESPINVYNFQVAGDHTYYVSDIGVLTHNSCNHKSEWHAERRSYWKSQGASYSGPTNQLSKSGTYKVTENNINRMLSGKAPIGTDNKSVQLHHVEGIVNNFKNYVEILASEHSKNFKILHAFLFK